MDLSRPKPPRSGWELVVQVSRRAAEEGVRRRMAQFDNLATLAQYRTLYEIALARLDPSMRVLDWGCGNGHFSYVLHHLGLAPLAYSFEPRPASMAGKARFQHVQGDPSEPVRLPFEDRSFEVVFSVGVLEHVHETSGDERASLREIRRTLSPGGLFICAHFPNRLGWTEVARRLGVSGHVHARRYRRRDIAALVGDAGLSLIEAGRYNFLPRNSITRLPQWLTRSHALTRGYDLLDHGLELALPPLCQNWYFIAQRKPAAK